MKDRGKTAMAGPDGAVGQGAGFRLTVVQRALVGLLALVVLGLSWWAWNVGRATALAIVSYNFTGIDVYQIFPGRALAASTQAQPFDLGARVALDGRWPADGFTDLEHLLEATGTVSYLVVRDGEIVYERYLDGRDETTPAQVFSVSKSILSALLGAALADGHIDSLDQPVTDFVPELADAGFGEVTLEHLLQMTSGMDYTENDNPFGEHAMFAYTRRLEAEILNLRLAEPPGGQWRYKSGDTALLSLVLARAVAPRTLTDFLHEALWEPMGMEHHGVWSTDREGGLERSWCCLAMTARDLATFGRLYLENGLLPEPRCSPRHGSRSPPSSTQLRPA
jgi:CubicO group peptidase (beta-lactamase class C family)